MNNPAPAGWHPDPTMRHHHRYWNGAQWTEHVSDNGIQSTDPLDAAPLTRREARQDQAVRARPTFRERRAAARHQRELQREAEAARKRVEQEEADALRRQREEERQRAREAAEARARQQAEEREQHRLAEIAREQQAREAAAREAREAEEREARVLQYPRFYLPEYNRYTGTEVAGEFARLDAIHAVLRRKPKLDEEIIVDDLLASLVPEPSNPHDRRAVKVVINGHHVGYLEKEIAALVQPAVLRVVEAGHLPTVGARLWAVARRDSYDGRKLRRYANVRLALPHAGSILPLNDPPFEDYSIIPWGGKLQVTGEEHHQLVLSEYVTDDANAVLIGTLAIIQGGTAKAPKDLIEIRIDGERVGQLTPASSQHFIPTVQHLQAQGLATAAWLRVAGSAIAAQVTIHAARAHELPTDWFEDPHTAPRMRGTEERQRTDADLDDAEIRRVMREPMWDES